MLSVSLNKTFLSFLLEELFFIKISPLTNQPTLEHWLEREIAQWLLFILYFHVYVHLRLKHAVLDTHQDVSMLAVKDREEGVVALQVYSTYQPIG